MKFTELRKIVTEKVKEYHEWKNLDFAIYEKQIGKRLMKKINECVETGECECEWVYIRGAKFLKVIRKDLM